MDFGMQIHLMTLFPQSMKAVLGESILKRAQERGFIDIQYHQIRDYTLNKQNQVDDYPYGGGRGCVMMAQPLHDCWKSICDSCGERIHTIFLSPCGKTFDQSVAKRLAEEHKRIILVCGHYEGVDERFIEECVDEELSLGDFVLTGGEIPAMAVCDAICRLIPGVLPDEECYTDESHWSGLLEYPQYTRPEVWNGRSVPKVLLSGHQGNIDRWRKKQSVLRTRLKRPDMFEKLRFTDKDDKALLEEIENELPRDTDKTLTERVSEYVDRIIGRVKMSPTRDLVIYAPPSASDFTELCIGKAYRAGFSDVSVVYKGDAALSYKVRYGTAGSFKNEDLYHKYDEIKRYVAEGAALLELVTETPGLFRDIPIGKIRQYQIAEGSVDRLLSELLKNGSFVKAPIPSLSWANTVFPDKPDEKAVAALWDSIIDASENSDFQPEESNISKLVCSAGNGTDFTVSVEKDLLKSDTSVVFRAVPRSANGKIIVTRPLLICGETVDGLSLIFENGMITETACRSGAKIIKSAFKLDDNAAFLDEIRLTTFKDRLSLYNASLDASFSPSVFIGRDSISSLQLVFGDGSLKISGYDENGVPVAVMEDGALQIR
ncbi:MAG: tRNA (guanosine(37)-N1)-methyltransferase TrmD [Clostridia bacterium]|nr:tRNA (guanosine(37)-N1)-methyltransferase TrmD [Clostridia bacterium]